MIFYILYYFNWIFMSLHDLLKKEVYLINFILFIFLHFFIYQENFLYNFLIISTIISILFLIRNKIEKFIGLSDLIIIILFLLTYELNAFIVFWFSFLGTSIFIGLIYRILIKSKEIPLIPCMLIAHIIMYLFGV